MSQVADKPQNIQEKIAEGKLNAWFGESVLLDQKFVKDDTKTVRDVILAVNCPHRREHLGGPVRPVQGRRGAVIDRRRDRKGIDRNRNPGGVRNRHSVRSTDSRVTQRILLHGLSVTAGPPVFRRVLLKLSGESFCRPGKGGISVEEVSRIAGRPRGSRPGAFNWRSSWGVETSSAAPSFPAAPT